MPLEPRKPERTYVKVDKAPPYVKELVGNIEVTIPIYKAFPALKEVVMAATLNFPTVENQADAAPVIIALNHLFAHLCLIRDQGKHDSDYIEKLKPKQ
jgi:hypothetical protein